MLTLFFLHIILSILNIAILYLISFLFFKIIFYFFIKKYRVILKKDNSLELLIKESFEFFKKELEIPEDFNVKLSNYYFDGIIREEGFLDYIGSDYKMHVNMKNTQYMIIRTVAHEMVHAQQFASKRLKTFNSTNMIVFDGIFYDGNMSYSKRPWEIEAFNKEKYLCKKFYNYKKIKKPFYNYILPI